MPVSASIKSHRQGHHALFTFYHAWLTISAVHLQVKFDIDANGILSVTATDKGTQKKQDIKITGASVLSSDEVDKMVKDAEKFADEDKSKRDAVDTKNQVRIILLVIETVCRWLGVLCWD